MSIDRDALRTAAESATPGPWTTSGPDTIGEGVLYDSARAIAHQNWDHPNRDENMAYIAAADPSTVLSLLDALAAAEEINAKIRKYADERAWYGARNRTVGSQRIASDLLTILGDRYASGPAIKESK